ncbi:MAG: thioredoxin [Gammaproteobacteria bacterium]|nr:MAG: thioredoxin [Gammaproteobacteria bacterium]
MSNIVYVNDAGFTQLVQSSELPVLVDFWAEWCGPCRAIAPVLEELSEEFAGKAIIAKMNVDENQQTPAQYGIRSIPTLMLFKNGEVTETLVGALPKAQFVQLLNQHI